MAISDVNSGSTRGWVFVCFLLTLIIAGQPAKALAENAPPKEFRAIIHDSLGDLWTGKAFSPELKERQQKLTVMLKAGAIGKTELESLLGAEILSLVDRQETSRYILKTMPDRVNALLAPVMDWEGFKRVLWKTLSSVADADNPLEIKIGTLAPPGTPWLSVPEAIAIPKIRELSDGKVLIKIYGGGVMGEDTDILRKMDIGQLDGCGCTASGVLAASPDASALLLPGLFNNYDEVDYIFEKFRKRLDRAFEEKGYILAALIDTGSFYWFSKKKITSLEDVRKAKVLTWFGLIETTLYQELGINATPVAVPEVVSALSTGLADTNLAPAAWMLGMQAYQYANYYLKPSLLYSPAAIFVSVHTKDRLQKQAGVSATYAQNIQEILVSEFNALEPEWKRQIRSYEQKSLKAFETKCGIKAITLSPEDQAVIVKASHAVLQKLSGKAFSQDLIDEIQKALAEYRAAN
jgi:TRAP-type C4-dicarboxylate transport system substrate-binding protein